MGLGDVYMQKAPSFSGDVARQVEGLGQQLPQLAAQKFQMDQAKAEVERQNAPVSPWQEAVMDLMQDHITPQEAAAKLRSRLGGTPPPVGMLPGPQQTGLERLPTQLEATRPGDTPPLASNLPRSLADTRMVPARSPYEGMTNRDYAGFTDALGKIGGMKQQRDYIAEIREKNKGSMDVANVRAKVDFAKMSSAEARAELERRIKEKSLDEREANHVAQIQLGWAKLKNLIEHWQSSSGSKEELQVVKMLLQHSASLANSGAKVFASPMSLMGNEDVDQFAGDATESAKKVHEAALERLKQLESQKVSVPSTASSKEMTRVSAPAATVGAPQKYKVGDTVDIGGGKKGRVVGFKNGRPQVERLP